VMAFGTHARGCGADKPGLPASTPLSGCAEDRPEERRSSARNEPRAARLKESSRDDTTSGRVASCRHSSAHRGPRMGRQRRCSTPGSTGSGPSVLGRDLASPSPTWRLEADSCRRTWTPEPQRTAQGSEPVWAEA